MFPFFSPFLLLILHLISSSSSSSLMWMCSHGFSASFLVSWRKSSVAWPDSLRTWSQFSPSGLILCQPRGESLGLALFWQPWPSLPPGQVGGIRECIDGPTVSVCSVTIFSHYKSAGQTYLLSSFCKKWQWYQFLCLRLMTLLRFRFNPFWLQSPM